MDALQKINSLPEAEALAAFLRCCGSARWAQAMTGARPFPSATGLHLLAAGTWRSLAPEDWQQAFASHPRIGAGVEARAGGEGSWASGEQAATAVASAELLEELRVANQAYEERFGYLYIVSASDKSAESMLADLRERLGNEPEKELRVAARQQEQITRLRLDKLLAELSSEGGEP